MAITSCSVGPACATQKDFISTNKQTRKSNQQKHVSFESFPLPLAILWDEGTYCAGVSCFRVTVTKQTPNTNLFKGGSVHFRS